MSVSRYNSLDGVLDVTINADMYKVWVGAITTWAHSQRSRRIALRCAEHEVAALSMLLDAYDTGYRLGFQDL